MQFVVHRSRNVLFISPTKIDLPKLKEVVNMVSEQDTVGRSYDDWYRVKCFLNNYALCQKRGRKSSALQVYTSANKNDNKEKKICL